MWNIENKMVSRVVTSEFNHEPVMMRLKRSGCHYETLVFRKAMMLGVMTDAYHMDSTNFWALSAGKILTITWVSHMLYRIAGAYYETCGTPDLAFLFSAACLPYSVDARTPATKLVGDFNGDKKSDIALLGPPGWNSVPIAFSNGDGTFKVTNLGIQDFAGSAAVPARRLTVRTAVAVPTREACFVDTKALARCRALKRHQKGRASAHFSF